MADKPQSSREEILASLGTAIDGIEVHGNQLLIGIYIKPERTAGGLYLTDKTRDEDKWQGKVGVVLAKGPAAFIDDGQITFHDQNAEVGDWVVYRVSDGFSLDIAEVHCRLIEDVQVRMVIPTPTIIY
jgi:co-chaperonin GroES (HSP10)